MKLLAGILSLAIATPAFAQQSHWMLMSADRQSAQFMDSDVRPLGTSGAMIQVMIIWAAHAPTPAVILTLNVEVDCTNKMERLASGELRTEGGNTVHKGSEVPWESPTTGNIPDAVNSACGAQMPTNWHNYSDMSTDQIVDRYFTHYLGLPNPFATATTARNDASRGQR